MTDPLASRRVVFQGLGALGVAAVLAACGGSGEPSAGETGDTPSPTPSPTPSRSPEQSPSESTSPKQKSRAPAEALASTAEIPVGGGIVLIDKRIVLTQPAAGEFRAFSAVCKHQGKTVGSVEDNTITCPYHGSQYDADTGDVTRGPAASGLDPIEITVAGGVVSLA